MIERIAITSNALPIFARTQERGRSRRRLEQGPACRVLTQAV
jgi:hypothetical protein